MNESGNLSPEVEFQERVGVYKIIPYKSSRESLVLYYNDKVTLRWSLAENGFDIKLWHSEDALHRDADVGGFRNGTTGYIDKRRGITFSDIRLFDDKKRAEITTALKKYLTT